MRTEKGKASGNLTTGSGATLVAIIVLIVIAACTVGIISVVFFYSRLILPLVPSHRSAGERVAEKVKRVSHRFVGGDAGMRLQEVCWTHVTANEAE